MRSLTPALDFIQLNATTRQPGWQVLLYDVRSTSDTINHVVRFNIGDIFFLQSLTGPRDFTADVLSVKVDEQRSDYVQSGVVATQVEIVFSDPSGILDPYLVHGFDPGDPGYDQLLGRFLRRGNVVVVRLGDTRVDSSEWPRIFTGEITGQAGRQRGRSDGALSTLTVKALSREAAFIKYLRTSNPFSGGQTHLQAAQEIAEFDMGLDLSEIALSGWGSGLFKHASVQFVEETPMAMLAKLMFQYSVMPRFNGDGVLTQYSTSITAAPDRIYDDFSLFRRFDRPYTENEQPNSVTVVGLDEELTKITQPLQVVAELNLTTGYFANNEEVEVYWSEDRTLIVEEPNAHVIQSAGISWLGGTEEFDEIPAPGPGGGTIGMVVTIDTGYAPWLVTALLVTVIVLAAIPDEVTAVIAGFTIPIGRIIQQVFLSAAMFVMTKIGRVQTQFKGKPIEWVYKELRSRAVVAGTSAFQENGVLIENHLINTQVACDTLAMNTLFLLQSQGNVREVEMILDIGLEPGDVFEVETTQRFMVDSISYTLTRGTPELNASVGCFEVTTGVLA